MLGRYQVRVYLRDTLTYTSGSNDAKVADDRCRTATLKAGIGAIGTVLEVLTQKSNKIGEHRVAFQARCVYVGDAGTLGLAPEDHTTPPPHA